MEVLDDNLSAIETKHRKEKRELQAKVTALKKTAKNDKSKKKELLTEIARLETELEAKHKQELSEYEEAHSSIEVSSTQPDLIEPELTKAKLSKAQKRRDKKSQQEKERHVQIMQQTKENLLGPRHIELQTITSKLKEKNLKIYNIPSDGDCLYKAVSHQLHLTRQEEYSVNDLRSKVSTYIQENKDDFFPFMSNPETLDMLTDAEFEEYCDKIKNTKVWGGQLEIRALSNIFQCPIYVIQAAGTDAIQQGTEFGGQPVVITYHRYMYGLGEHYNSTIENDGDENESDTSFKIIKDQG